MVKDYVLIAVIIILGAFIVELGFGDNNLGVLGADKINSDFGEESEVSQSLEKDDEGEGPNSTEENAESQIGYQGYKLVIHENSFSYSRMELVEGEILKIENRDERTHDVTVSGLEVERRLPPGEEIDIEALAGDYQLSSSEISNKTVYLDINLD